jgi:DNA-binding GntR family transcriptional regulator
MAAIHRKTKSQSHLPTRPARPGSLSENSRVSAALVRLGAEADYEAYNNDFHSTLYRGAHSKHVEELILAMRARLAPFPQGAIPLGRSAFQVMERA